MQKIPARTNASSIRRGGDLQVQGAENLPFLLFSLQRTFDKEKTYPNPFLYKIGFGYALFGRSGCGALNFRRACNALEHSDRCPCSSSAASAAGSASLAQQYRTRTGAASAMPVQNKNPRPQAPGFCFGGPFPSALEPKTSRRGTVLAFSLKLKFSTTRSSKT